MIRKLILLVFVVSIGCTEPTPTAQEVVDQAIEYSNAEKLRKGSATFDFRSMSYEYWREKWSYKYTRIQTDTAANEIRDELTNEGLIRYINGEEATISEARRAAYTSSVNSVMYFAFLPLWLNDPAVNKFYVGTIEIEGNMYHKIKITFSEKGGGEDFEDVFYYWFDTSDFSMDYLAYSYIEKEGTGMRFRRAFNARSVNGVIIQDYINMKPISSELQLKEIDKAYINDALEQLSIIELKNVNINLN